MLCVQLNRIKKSDSPVKLREKMLNFVVKYCENCMFCRAQVIIRWKTSHISWRHSTFLEQNGKGDEARQYHDVKTMAKWPKGIGVTWSLFYSALNLPSRQKAKRAKLKRGEIFPCVQYIQWYTVYRENFAPVLFLPFSPSELRAKFKTGLIELQICKYEGLCKKIGEWVNSRLGKSVLELYRAKIRLGEFKAVYST